ncbi:hypothetical protein DVR12_03815 [Chitinophaga silvatica]|uniref:PGAP1-like protein n=1 Tax=Chitinophaga silvatica TaxID=2282649 RepID=A0A3E1YHL9_9BACT|nr:caspase family protein [Chitinophaga silvatica]RFS26923.1 hypothetical protein DVR12_03815 [Chitinophaga silvatica]
MHNLYALIVGINNYHPDLNIPPLSGCINDALDFRSYLEKIFPEERRNIVQLLGKEATRKGVIETFKTHLIDNKAIQKGDIVLFYFSGHGSFMNTAPEFYQFDATGKDETLVLYDSRLPGNYDLADKEIALLLNKIPKETDIVVIVDACHSGSITRALADSYSLGRAKFASSQRTARPLNKYLSLDDELNYEKMAEKGKLNIPETRHLVMSACSRDEVAYERGDKPTAMFTDALLGCLNEEGELPPAYSQVFEHVYALLRRRAQRQTPQLKVYNGFNPDARFLGELLPGKQPFYKVVYERDRGMWTINCGAINGLRNDTASMKSTAVKIYFPEGDTLVVPLVAVGLNKSELPDLKLKDKNKLYAASIELPPIISIQVEGSEENIAEWTTLVSSKPGNRIFFFSPENKDGADYTLSFHEEGYIVLLNEQNDIVHGVETITPATMEYMFSSCKQVCDWHQFQTIENHAMTNDDFQKTFKTNFEIEVLTDPNSDTWQSIVEETTCCLIPGKEYRRKINVTNNTDSTWYASVYFLSSRYGLSLRTSEGSAELMKGKVLPGLDRTGRLGITSGDHETLRFKLLISKTPFQDYTIPKLNDLEPEVIAPAALNLVGNFMGDFPDDSLDQEWYVKTITINLLSAVGNVGPQESYELGELSISSHPEFSASVGISDIDSKRKDINSAGVLRQVLKAKGLEVIDVRGEVDPAGPLLGIITLSGLGDTKALKDEPLVLKLRNESVSNNKGMMAVTLVDGIIVPLAIGEEENGHTRFEINALPDDQTAEKSKNLIRAVWFCLVKVVTGINLSRLRNVDFIDGIMKYRDGEAKIPPGEKALVVIHGIIGDTKGQAACMQSLIERKQYDLLLAYDYENLNLPIEKIAEDFMKQLGKAGAGKENRRIDIVAHSMGGLVSRYMIEYIKEADGWVTKLYMFGTPNGGSAFGMIPVWRNRMQVMLTLAANVSKIWAAGLSSLLSAINYGLSATQEFTNTLQQMNEDSKFYKDLNGKAANFKLADYHIIAGNQHAYVPEDQAWYNRLMENIELQVGEWVYWKKDNDIAVAVESIEKVPEDRQSTSKTVGCHHLNYFEAPASVNYFKSLKDSEENA